MIKNAPWAGKAVYGGGSFTALVVDDQADVLTLASMMLDALGFQVDSVGSSREAMDLLATTTYRLVLTDLKMPGMNGYELASWVKSRSRDTRLVIMTGCLDSEYLRESGPGPVDRWIFKPFGFKELRLLLEEIL